MSSGALPGRSGRMMRPAVMSDASNVIKAVGGGEIDHRTAQHVGGQLHEAARCVLQSFYWPNELYNLHIPGHGS